MRNLIRHILKETTEDLLKKYWVNKWDKEKSKGNMPRYDYKCAVCSSQVEFERGFGEDREPVCCSQSMQRVWTATAALAVSPKD